MAVRSTTQTEQVEAVLMRDFKAKHVQLDALIKVYGLVPEYRGRGQPRTCKQARPGWQ